MPRIDPLKLLTCLKVLLASNGGIRSENEVKRLAGLMTKYSKKLVSKCIYIQILKCTNTELLGEFMGAGGWSLTHMWLSDGIHAMNWPLVQEILELLLLCPVDVQRLRSNTAPKLVKGLCQNGGNEGVRILATKLVEQWLKVVKGETMPTLQTNNHAVNQSSVPQTTAETAIPQANKVIGNAIKNSTTDKTNAAIAEPAQASGNEQTEEDPLAIPSNKIGESAIPQGPLSPPVAQKASGENALVYQIIVKDGKQVLAKIENSSSGEKTEKLVSDENETKMEENKETKSDEKDVDASNKENEKHKNKESEGKDTKESLKDKEKSRTSRDKEKHRDHKSSSHRSSSSKSSKSSSSSSTSTGSKIKSSSSHKNSSESKSREKDSDKDRDTEKEKEKHKSSRSSSSTRDKSRDRERSSKDKERKDREKDKDKEKEKERDKEKEKIDQAEKDKETLSKVIPPSLDKLGKIPKKPKDESEKSTPTSILIPSKKASISIEIRKDSENRPKTVKTYKSQFRSHGLSEEAPPPPSRKGLKKPSSQPVLGTAIPSSTLNLNLKRSSPPPASASSSPSSNSSSKDTAAPPVEKKLKLDMTNAGIPEKPGAIKLITPKPKPSTLVESDLFMDALSASAYFKKDTKKRKRRPSASKEAAKEGSNNTSPPESPQSASPTNKVTPLKFYQDTLEEKDEERMEFSEESKEEKDDEKKEDEDDIPLKRVKESIEEKVRQEKEEEVRRRELEEDDEEPPSKKPPGPGCGPDGPPGVLMLHRRRGPKKKLTWRPQEELEDIRYFELDETERVNVTKTFTDMKQMERYNEREAFLMARKLNGEDIMSEQTTWMPLILVDDVPPHPEGSQSKEKKIQAERELTTLKALYFNRHMIPDSPAEPDMDMEQYQKTEPAVIPLDDITGNPDAVNDFTSMPWPDPKGSPPQCMPDDYGGPPEVPMNNGPFNPFMQFGQPGWAPMGGPPGPAVPPSNMMPPNLMGDPMGGFNNMNPMNAMPPNMNMGPPNMMMGPGPGPEVMPMNQMNNMNMMQPPFGPVGPNFGGPPNGPNNFGNFGPPPPNMNMSPPMNMNNGPPPPRNNNRGGNWRSGSGPPNNQGGNWRPQGPGNNRNWTHGGGNNARICKQFQRGYCRNGNKCNFLHPPKNF